MFFDNLCFTYIRCLQFYKTRQIFKTTEYCLRGIISFISPFSLRWPPSCMAPRIIFHSIGLVWKSLGVVVVGNSEIVFPGMCANGRN